MKYIVMLLSVILFMYPIRVNAEDGPIVIHRTVSLSYEDVTSFEIYNKGSKTYYVYKLESFLNRFGINNTGLYPSGMVLSSQILHYEKTIEQRDFQFYNSLLTNPSVGNDSYYFLIVDNNDLYIVLDSHLKPLAFTSSGVGPQFQYTWSDFQPISGSSYHQLYVYMHDNNYTYSVIILAMTQVEYFNSFGFYVEFTQELDEITEIDYDSVYKVGYNDGKQVGYNQGHAEGYAKGYKDGKEYGYSIADGEVNALASIFPNVIGSIWGVAKDFLSMPIYGVTPWQIFAALSSISLVILAIRLFR